MIDVGAVLAMKMRLVVSFFFRAHKHRSALIKLYRPFVSAAAMLARAQAFGAPNEPSNFDTTALAALVETYMFAPKLEITWSTQLTQPEKLTIDREVGAGADVRLAYGIEVTAQCLELSVLMATESEVHGARFVYNEVTRMNVSFPIHDFRDQLTIPAVKQIDPGSYDLVDVRAAG